MIDIYYKVMMRKHWNFVIQMTRGESPARSILVLTGFTINRTEIGLIANNYERTNPCRAGGR